jgi:hypothetical protein
VATDDDDTTSAHKAPNEEPKRLKLTIDETRIGVVKAARTKWGPRQQFGPVELAQVGLISLGVSTGSDVPLPELTRHVNEWAANNLDADTQALYLPLSETTVWRALQRRG